MARRWMPFALTVGAACLAVVGALALGALSGRNALEHTLADGSWFPTDAVENGELLAIDDDGRALVGFGRRDDRRTVDDYLVSWEGTFGERPGVAIVEPSGTVTVLAEPVPIDPETSEWVTADINGDMVAWAYLSYPDTTDGASPQTIWVSRGGGSPVAVQPMSVDGTWVELRSKPNIYVTDSFLVGTTGSYPGGVVAVRLDDGLTTVIEPWAEGTAVPLWIHRDLCAEASGVEAYTYALMTEGAGDTLGDILKQWTVTLNRDGTHVRRQIPLVTEVEKMGIPTTACGDHGANALRPIPGGGAIGYRTDDSYEVAQSSDRESYRDVYRSQEYVLGVPLSPFGVVVTEVATGTTTTWGNGEGCGSARLRGSFLSYPVTDQSGVCRMAVVDLATATPPVSTPTPSS